jgi:hypothetical protein
MIMSTLRHHVGAYARARHSYRGASASASFGIHRIVTVLTLVGLLCGLATPSAYSQPVPTEVETSARSFDGNTDLTRQASAGSTKYLSDMTWASAKNGWGPVEKDKSNGQQAAGDGRTITLNGKTYAKGLGMHGPADVRYALGGLCSTFSAEVGIDDEVGNEGSVVFQVWADGAKVWDSGTMKGDTATKPVKVNVAGKQELRLVVTDGGNGLQYDHADWGAAAVACTAGSSPTPTPTPSPSPTPPPTGSCTSTLQSLVNAAASGSSLTVPACVFRETVTISKPLTLVAQRGAEIRGSDVWTGWTRSGAYWVKGSVPTFPAHGECRSGSNGRCLWPEQVFFDGRPLGQVASNPTSGQFAVNGSRQVILADDPNGHTVEVTIRTAWIIGQADNVTIKGFVMKHSANDAQKSAIQFDGRSSWTLDSNTLSDTHGNVVAQSGGRSLKFLNNDIFRGGQQGAGTSETYDVLWRGNKIHDNNTEDFDPGWSGGGEKSANLELSIYDGNEAYNNRGPGLWCDENCRNVEYKNNKSHHNEQEGIFFEISEGAKIHDNAVWENGWGRSNSWCYGAGILASSSRNVEIWNNTVGWNNNNISIISQRRGMSWNPNDVVDGVSVHHNQVMGTRTGQGGLNWCQDWAGSMFRSNNSGSNNAYWYPDADGSYNRFGWNNTGISRLVDFNATPGEEGGRYLSAQEKDQALSGRGIPKSPEAR